MVSAWILTCWSSFLPKWSISRYLTNFPLGGLCLHHTYHFICPKPLSLPIKIPLTFQGPHLTSSWLSNLLYNSLFYPHNSCFPHNSHLRWASTISFCMYEDWHRMLNNLFNILVTCLKSTKYLTLWLLPLQLPLTIPISIYFLFPKNSAQMPFLLGSPPWPLQAELRGSFSLYQCSLGKIFIYCITLIICVHPSSN